MDRLLGTTNCEKCDKNTCPNQVGEVCQECRWLVLESEDDSTLKYSTEHLINEIKQNKDEESSN